MAKIFRPGAGVPPGMVPPGGQVLHQIPPAKALELANQVLAHLIDKGCPPGPHMALVAALKDQATVIVDKLQEAGMRELLEEFVEFRHRPGTELTHEGLVGLIGAFVAEKFHHGDTESTEKIEDAAGS